MRDRKGVTGSGREATPHLGAPCMMQGRWPFSAPNQASTQSPEPGALSGRGCAGNREGHLGTQGRTHTQRHVQRQDTAWASRPSPAPSTHQPPGDPLSPGPFGGLFSRAVARN